MLTASAIDMVQLKLNVPTKAYASTKTRIINHEIQTRMIFLIGSADALTAVGILRFINIKDVHSNELQWPSDE